jgi:hypothetical protein
MRQARDPKSIMPTNYDPKHGIRLNLHVAVVAAQAMLMLIGRTARAHSCIAAVATAAVYNASSSRIMSTQVRWSMETYLASLQCMQ